MPPVLIYCQPRVSWNTIGIPRISDSPKDIVASIARQEQIISPRIAALALPLVPIAALAAFGGLPLVHGNPRLLASFAAAVGVLLVFWMLLVRASRTGARVLRY